MEIEGIGTAELARVVREVASAVTDPADPVTSADEVLRSAAEALGASGASLFIADHDSALLLPAAAYGPQAAFVKDIAPVDAEHEHNEMAQVFMSGEAIYVADFYPDSQIDEDAEGVARWRSAITTGSHAVLPLRARNKTLGVVTLQWVDAQDFTPDRTTLVASVAATVAAVVERATRAQEPPGLPRRAEASAPVAEAEQTAAPEPASAPAGEPPASAPPTDEPPFLTPRAPAPQPFVIPRTTEGPRVVRRGDTAARPGPAAAEPEPALRERAVTPERGPADLAAPPAPEPRESREPLVLSRRQRPEPRRRLTVVTRDGALRTKSDAGLAPWAASLSAIRVDTPAHEGLTSTLAFWEAFRLPSDRLGLAFGLAECARDEIEEVSSLVAAVIRSKSAEGVALANASRRAEARVASLHGEKRLRLFTAAIDLCSDTMHYRTSNELHPLVVCCGGRAKRLAYQAPEGPASLDFLMTGDTLLLATPSLAAARRAGVQGDEYGLERIVSRLATMQPLPATGIPEALFGEVAGWADWWPPADVLVLGITRHA